MEQSPQNTEKSSTAIVIFGTVGISLAVGFMTLVLLVFLFIVVVDGGPEWGPTLVIFAAPFLAIVMTMGSFFIMGIHAFVRGRRQRPLTSINMIIWAASWLSSLSILALPFIYSLIDDNYFWPENSLVFTVPLTLFIGMLLGVGMNTRIGRPANTPQA